MTMTNDEAIDLLADKPGDFPQGLRQQYKAKGALSPKQWEWAHKLAQEVLDARAFTQDEAAGRPAVAALFAVLDRAEVRIARLMIGDKRVKLRRNKASTSYYALLGDALLGSILKDGQLRAGHGLRESGISKAQLLDGLAAFGADPVGASVIYGRETGTCGICGRRLVDPESVALGIGPICKARISQ